MKHPMQHIHYAKDGVIRFRENKIVRFLLEKGPFDLNMIGSMEEFSAEDRMQLAQLIGYSVIAFGDLCYADEKSVAKADKVYDKLKSKRK